MTEKIDNFIRPTVSYILFSSDITFFLVVLTHLDPVMMDL